MTYEEAHRSSTPAAYVTFQFGGKEFDKYQEFVVGNKAKSSSTTRTKRSFDPQEYENKPLQPNTNYRVFLRAFVSEVLYPQVSLFVGLKVGFFIFVIPLFFISIRLFVWFFFHLAGPTPYPSLRSHRFRHPVWIWSVKCYTVSRLTYVRPFIFITSFRAIKTHFFFCRAS